MDIVKQGHVGGALNVFRVKRGFLYSAGGVYDSHS